MSKEQSAASSSKQAVWKRGKVPVPTLTSKQRKRPTPPAGNTSIARLFAIRKSQAMSGVAAIVPDDCYPSKTIASHCSTGLLSQQNNG
jgi:hypothetical protein